LTEETIAAQVLAREAAKMGAVRIVYTDTLRDGTMSGPNITQTSLIAKTSGLKVTASGGVSSLDDLRRLKEVSSCGIDSVIVGRALYEGRFTLSEALNIAG
jgi:phosphoribosylformimino-5-aminoimidazole carboxamide ribotide isomerase